jgi:hypothetical protein
MGAAFHAEGAAFCTPIAGAARDRFRTNAAMEAPAPMPTARPLPFGPPRRQAHRIGAIAASPKQPAPLNVARG